MILDILNREKDLIEKRRKQMIKDKVQGFAMYERIKGEEVCIDRIIKRFKQST